MDPEKPAKPSSKKGPTLVPKQVHASARAAMGSREQPPPAKAIMTRKDKKNGDPANPTSRASSGT